MRSPLRALLWSTTALAALGGCAAEPLDARSAWLLERIEADNADLIERSPALAAQKLAAMAVRPHDFFRGTVRLFAEDATQPGPEGHATNYGGRAAAEVSIVGDPHYENLGTFRAADGTLLLDYNDFDAASFGPYWFDLRRLCLSFSVVARLVEAHDQSFDTRLAVTAVAEGYVFELRRLERGEAPFRVHADSDAGPIVADVFESAAEDGAVRGELDEDTELVGERRRLRIASREQDSSELLTDELRPVTRAERVEIEALLTHYPRTLFEAPTRSFEVLDVARRLGAGVASLASLRYYALVRPVGAEADADPSEDRILEIKEVRDPPLPRWSTRPRRPFVDNAARVVLQQRLLQERPDTDAFLGWAASGRVSFRIRERTKFQKRLSLDRLSEEMTKGDFSGADFVALGDTAGRLLARSHALAPGADGRPGLGPIVEALHGDDAGFVVETVAFTRDARALIESDFERFQELLRDRGPLLGHRFSPVTR